jgi:hypothetical protein
MSLTKALKEIKLAQLQIIELNKVRIAIDLSHAFALMPNPNQFPRLASTVVAAGLLIWPLPA